jgi:hypothetical protein
LLYYLFINLCSLKYFAYPKPIIFKPKAHFFREEKTNQKLQIL